MIAATEPAHCNRHAEKSMDADSAPKPSQAAIPGEPPDDWTRAVFASVDAMDVGTFTGFMTDDVRFQFAGQPQMSGRLATSDYLQAFFGSLDAITHDLKWQIRHRDTLIVHGQVAYRVGAGTANVSWINVLQIRDGKIADYLIFVDSAPLFGLLATHGKVR
jgi:ketosteroid isomerase-like protein